MSEATVTRWWWLRHAPVIGMTGEIVGQADPDADCDDGSIRALAERLPADAVVVASPLRRSRQTAAALRGEPTVIEPDLMEQHFGAWQGRRWGDLADDPVARRFWRTPATTAPPDGESFAQVVARTTRAIDCLTAAHAGADILAVGHAGTIRAALAHALGLTAGNALGFVIDPLSLTRIDRIDDGVAGNWRIGGVNLPHEVATVT